jgi:hypothetical protein
MTVVPAPVPLDTNYLGRLESRMAALERRSLVSREELKHTGRDLLLMHSDLRIELDALKKDLSDLDVKTKLAVDRLKHTIAQFRTTAKQGDLSRIQSRVDAWAPESRITRAQFKRLIEQEI